MYRELQKPPDNNKSTTITEVYRTYKNTNNNGRQQHGCRSSTEEHADIMIQSPCNNPLTVEMTK
jgi:hypothetical protein